MAFPSSPYADLASGPTDRLYDHVPDKPTTSADKPTSKISHRSQGSRPAQLQEEPAVLGQVSPPAAYARLLRDKAAVETVWDTTAAILASPTDAGGLSWRKPVMLARVRGGIVCSCSESRDRRHRLISSLGPCDSAAASAKCLHAEAAERLPLTLGEASPPEDGQVSALRLFQDFAAVSCAGVQLSIALVRRRPHVKCLDCDTSHCRHTGAYRSSELGEEDRERSETAGGGGPGVGTERTRQVPTSSLPRSLPLQVPTGPPPQRFSPATEQPKPVCSCGNVWAEERVSPPSGRSILIGRRGGITTAIRLYAFRGQGCGCVLDYDGSGDGLFHTKRGVLLDQGLLADVLGALSTATPLANFHKSLDEANRVSGGSPVLSLRDLQNAWEGFLSLLQPPPPVSFACPKCGAVPDTVILDGITLGHRKTSGPPEAPRPPSESSSEPLAGSSHRDRIALREPETRRLLATFSKEGGDPPQRLLRLLRRELPELAAFVAEAAESPPQMRKLYLPFLCDLAKPSPVCSLVPASLASPVHEIIAGRNPCEPGQEELWGRLCSDAPALLASLAPLFKARAEVPPRLCALLDRLVRTSQAAFAVPSRDPAAYPPPEPEPTSNFFPHWPRLRSLATYSRPTSTNDSCNKEKVGHPRLISGVLLYFCKHGICYGYEAMVNPESVAFAFATIFTRFAKAPSTVVYDNACNLHAFFLNREPRFARKTRFVSDRFHSGNHVACNSGYDLRKQSLHPGLRGLNSEAAEQANSRLVRLKPSLSYMSPENFHLHLRLFLASFNAAKASKA